MTTPRILLVSGSSDWGTPAAIIAAARAVLGSIDLDPCSTACANQTVGAAHYYSAERDEDGLCLPWQAQTLWMNPPFGREVGRWATRLVEQYENKNFSTGLALFPVRPDTRWWKILNQFPICTLWGRLKFLVEGVPSTNSATFPVAIVNLGCPVGTFVRHFGPLGTIYVPVSCDVA